MIPFNPMWLSKPYVPPASGISIGRSNSASITGSGGSFAIGWASGGAAANGTWLVLVARDNISNTWNITGGAAWTQLGTTKIWYKQCGASEPTTYAISYSGSSKDDTACMSMIEILGASSMEVSNTGANSLTPPTLTGMTAGNIGVLVGGDNGGGTGVITAPSGYTLQTKRDTADAMTAIATKTGLGTSESPGNWSITNSVTFNVLASLAFKA